MAFPNLSDIVVSTIEKRSPEVADNVLKNNAVFARLKQKGKVRPFSGGTKIYQAFSFQENQNFGWYSGYDLLPTAAQDVLSGAEFAIKQCAVPVMVSGLEQLQNSGPEAILDLLETRMGVAESTMVNRLSEGVYSDGTGYGGKQIVGLQGAAPVDPTTGTYGSVDRALWLFWRSQLQAAGAMTAATIQLQMNQLWAKLCRGKDKPDLIVLDAQLWGIYVNSLQAIQRFVDKDSAKLGFPSVGFMTADVVLDGGIGGFAPANSGWFLNTDYLHYRPHKDRNMVALQERTAFGQDATARVLAWAGAMTCSGAQFQGFLKGY